MTPEKEKYREETGTDRWLKSKDVAQAVAAFLGFPGEAKDKIRFFFEGQLSSEFGQLSYKDVYKEVLFATQLLLPALMYRRISAEVDRDKEDINLGAGFDWLGYSRLHLLWLSGELLRSKYRLPRTLFPKELSQSLIDSMDGWLEAIYKTARASIKSAVSELIHSDQYQGHREFFRSPVNYRLILDKLPLALDFARTSGLDPLAKLPKQ